jgi:hypothetical protein
VDGEQTVVDKTEALDANSTCECVAMVSLRTVAVRSARSAPVRSARRVFGRVGAPALNPQFESVRHQLAVLQQRVDANQALMEAVQARLDAIERSLPVVMKALASNRGASDNITWMLTQQAEAFAAQSPVNRLEAEALTGSKSPSEGSA